MKKFDWSVFLYGFGALFFVLAGLFAGKRYIKNKYEEIERDLFR